MNKIEYRQGFGVFMEVLVNGKPQTRQCQIIMDESNPMRTPTPILRSGERLVSLITGEMRIISEATND